MCDGWEKEFFVKRIRIEEVAEKKLIFLEVRLFYSFLRIYQLVSNLISFIFKILKRQVYSVDEDMRKIVDAFPKSAHPFMGVICVTYQCSLNRF